MQSKLIKDAVGQALCHDMTRIVAGKDGGAPQKTVPFKKGHVITAEDIPLLLSMGKERVFVWHKPDGFLHEDEAAESLDALVRGSNLRRTGPHEGKIEHYAEIDGLLRLDVKTLQRINAISGLAVAARHHNSAVKKDELVAAMKAIPLIIEAAKLEKAARAAAAPLVNILPYQLKTAAVIATGSEIAAGRIADTFTPVVRQKLARFGIDVTAQKTAGDRPEEICRELEAVRAAGAGLILCTGGMSVDPDDRTPGALKRFVKAHGGRIVCYGIPVFPGAMFLLAYLPDKTPVLGLPGCVMSAKATIFDIILPRLAAGVPVTKKDLTRMGHGGLCLDGKGCNGACHFPQCAFGRV